MTIEDLMAVLEDLREQIKVFEKKLKKNSKTPSEKKLTIKTLLEKMKNFESKMSKGINNPDEHESLNRESIKIWGEIADFYVSLEEDFDIKDWIPPKEYFFEEGYNPEDEDFSEEPDSI